MLKGGNMWQVLLINSVAFIFLFWTGHPNPIQGLIEPEPLSEYQSFKTTSFKPLKKLYQRYWVQTEWTYLLSKNLSKWLLLGWGVGVLGLGSLHWMYGVGLFLLPILLLEQRLLGVNKSIEKAIVPLFTTLNAALLRNQDLIYAMQAAEKTTHQKTVYEGIRHFNTGIQSGMSPEVAFKRLYERTQHHYLKYVYLNIEQAYLKRGDLIKLMSALEEEYLLIQVERNKRVAETHSYLNLTWLSMGILLLTAYKVYGSNDYIALFYQRHPEMVGLLFGLSVLAILIFYKAIRHPVE